MALIDLQIWRSLWGIPHPPQSQILIRLSGLGQRDFKKKTTESPSSHSTKEVTHVRKAKRTGADDGKTRTWSKYDFWGLPPAQQASSESCKFNQACVPGIAFGGSSFTIQLYRISPLYRWGHGSTETSVTREVWCWSVSLSSSSSDRLSGTERWKSSHRWYELHFYLRITSVTGVAPQCSECLQLAFHFHFRYSIMLPHSQIYLLHPVCMSQTIYWMRQNDSKTHCQNHLPLLGFRGQLPKKQVYLVKNSVFLKFSSWYQVYCRFWAEYLWIQPETFTKYPPRKNTLGVIDMSKLT